MSVSPMPASPRYTLPAISLHWLVAVLIFGGFGLGIYMVDLPLSPAKLKYFSWHKWIGVTVFLLALLRAIWRMTHRPPPLPDGMPSWQRRASDWTHRALYALMYLIPLSGWTYSSAAGYQTVYLGLIPLPNLVEKNKPLAESLKEFHELLAWTLAALVVLHILAAIKHQVVDRDGLMRRMLPGGH